MDQTRHAREMAANLLLGRALHTLDADGGIVCYQDVGGRWNLDRFALPRRPNRLKELEPFLNALLEWTLHREMPTLVSDLTRSAWCRHLMQGVPPPPGSAAAAPLAQRGQIWGALAVYRSQVTSDSMEVLHLLAELATEPLSLLDAGRPEGVVTG